MTDTKQTEQTETTANTVENETETATPDKPVDKGNQNGCWSHCSKVKPRWKLFAAIALIAFVGFILGRGSAHHHNGFKHHYNHYQQQMSETRQKTPESLSLILDAIQASPEQRSKAVLLFR